MPDDAERRAIAAVLTRAGPDPHVTAAEIVQVFRAHGWRPVVTQPPPQGRPLPARTVHQLAGLARQGITREADDG